MGCWHCCCCCCCCSQVLVCVANTAFPLRTIVYKKVRAGHTHSLHYNSMKSPPVDFAPQRTMELVCLYNCLRAHAGAGVLAAYALTA